MANLQKILNVRDMVEFEISMKHVFAEEFYWLLGKVCVLKLQNFNGILSA